ncbi:MAG: hypothetical protein HY000_32790 [Planctomycetes bacterium]|nr:hypothetical protein [Planctomycetota bacterium]
MFSGIKSVLAIFVIPCAALAIVLAWRFHGHQRVPASQERAAASIPPRVLAPAGALIEDYIGPNECVACHTNICAKQGKSHMANALHSVEEWQREKGNLPAGRISDTVNNIQYEIFAQGEGLVLKATRGDTSIEAPMHFVLGSGANGLSFVRETDTDFQELRVAFFPKNQTWDFSPGHRATLPRNADEMIGTRRPKDSSAACLSCHSTLLVEKQGRVDLELSVLGVTCERCHGPGRGHVEAARRGEYVAPLHPELEKWLDQAREASDNPRGLASARQMRLCGQCHGGDRFDTDDLLLAEYTVTALQQSRCFTESSGRLRCTDCHDPHSNAQRGDHTRYVETCNKCHGSPTATASKGGAASVNDETSPAALPVSASGSTCRVNPGGDCITCHMPRRQPIDRGFFTHHRIGMHPAVNVEVFGKQPPP